MTEAPIIVDLPDDLAAKIGRIVVTYTKLEHLLKSLVALLLQLNKPEKRLILKSGSAPEMLELALDIFAIKAIEPKYDCVTLRKNIENAAIERNQVAHGLWLRDSSGQILLQLTRSSWSKDDLAGLTVKRAIFPETIIYGIAEADAAIAVISLAIGGANDMGKILDHSIRSFPERFREPAPLMSRTGHRRPKSKAKPRRS